VRLVGFLQIDCVSRVLLRVIFAVPAIVAVTEQMPVPPLAVSWLPRIVQEPISIVAHCTRRGAPNTLRVSLWL